MDFIIFEDTSPDLFYPLSLTRPLWDLRSGIFTFKERLEVFIHSHFSGERRIHYFTREYLAPLYRSLYPDLSINDYSVFAKDTDLFFLTGTLHPDTSLGGLAENTVLMDQGKPVVARVQGPLECEPGLSPAQILEGCAGARRLELATTSRYTVTCLHSIWDVMRANGARISDDFDIFIPESENHMLDAVTIIGDRGLVFIEEGATIDPQVVLDVKGGPVIIQEGARVHSFSRIEGPCVIGKQCIILGARVRGGTTIGPCCRIGGEVDSTIFHGYANKAHDGFIGHSYIGEWVNMGAMTTNSDLKNNYGEVKVYTPAGRKRTGDIKIGCFVGDYAKMSIGTLLNTGASVGAGAMLVHGGSLVPAHVPPFAWFIENKITDVDWLTDFLRVCETMMPRRGKRLTDEGKEMLCTLFEERGRYHGR